MQAFDAAGVAAYVESPVQAPPLRYIFPDTRSTTDRMPQGLLQIAHADIKNHNRPENGDAPKDAGVVFPAYNEIVVADARSRAWEG